MFPKHEFLIHLQDNTQLSSNLPRVKKIAHGIWLQKINIGIKTKLFAQKFTMDTDSFLKKIILKMGAFLAMEIN